MDIKKIKSNLEVKLNRKSKISLKDIRKVIKAKQTGNWNDVYCSKMYNNHSVDYCVLLEIL
jgi:hypothetical protein